VTATSRASCRCDGDDPHCPRCDHYAALDEQAALDLISPTHLEPEPDTGCARCGDTFDGIMTGFTVGDSPDVLDEECALAVARLLVSG
jgi:hypothetical protein